MKVSEIMTRYPVCCWPSSSTLSAALLMQETDTGIVPVIQDPFTPTLVGVVTDRDLCLHVIAGGRDPASTWVDACMTSDPICCSEQDEISVVLDLMKTHQIRRLPVVNEKHEIVGMLSLGDLVRMTEIEAAAIVRTLRSICEPVQGGQQRSRRNTTAA
ncbi:MAG TPA: CBS domain-containing protein [Terriglobales bacterium]|nr:CBS domain-containing protein [Terriglobales bacterium]